MPDAFNSPDRVTRMGEEIYFSKLQSQLEPQHNGEFVVIEVDSGKHFVNKDLLIAVNQARAEFPNKLFYIAPIGSISRTTSNNFSYAWEI